MIYIFIYKVMWLDISYQFANGSIIMAILPWFTSLPKQCLIYFNQHNILHLLWNIQQCSSSAKKLLKELTSAVIKSLRFYVKRSCSKVLPKLLPIDRHQTFARINQITSCILFYFVSQSWQFFSILLSVDCICKVKNPPFHEIKGLMSEMPIEQTAGAGESPSHEENGALRKKLGDITLDTDQVFLK